MKTYIWVLVVLFIPEGLEHDWKSFSRESECIEIIEVLTKHREDIIKARCEKRSVNLNGN